MEQVDGSADEREILYGIHAVREAVLAGARPIRRIAVVRIDRRFGDLVRIAKAKDIPVHVEPPAVFHRLVPHGRHQGVIAFVAAKPYSTVEDILKGARVRREPPLLVLLDGVEDPHNVGAVLRTVEAVGAHGVFIPERRAVGLTAAVAKASAGAVDYVAVCQVTNLSRLLVDLKREGIWAYGVEPTASMEYTDLDMTGPLAFVFGGEGSGIRPGVSKVCDGHIRIPMKGRVASLNVSAAVAVILYEAARQRRGLTTPQSLNFEQPPLDRRLEQLGGV
ncbi:MAG: 23S rRNA (guanosine(2251)-2'-O)-methyltransferase RlmB [Nitrospira sp.]|nr:23S rRNA (guanosine(2251)-2'-O)-methyltransferase RlmB [Nitrospira sp.]MCP9441875.1 23S rRNA (guanosine(2251)-2'-O)-methyltransferase RlmB [Nitrospira sp.]